jgi:hypothetical protein
MGFSAREAVKGNEPGTGACGHVAAALVPLSFPAIPRGWPASSKRPQATFPPEMPRDDLVLPGILPV